MTLNIIFTVLIVLFNCFDIYSTYQGFRLGAVEGNFIVRWFISKLGFWGSVLAFKIPLMTALIIFGWYVNMLWILVVLGFIFSILNIYTWVKLANTRL